MVEQIILSSTIIILLGLFIWGKYRYDALAIGALVVLVSISSILELEIINPEEQRVKFQLGSNEQKDRHIEEVFMDGNLLGNWKLNVTVLDDIPIDGSLKVTIIRDWLSKQNTLPQKRLFFFKETDKISYHLLDLFF